jgi:hypothetical protein
VCGSCVELRPDGGDSGYAGLMSALDRSGIT